MNLQLNYNLIMVKPIVTDTSDGGIWVGNANKGLGHTKGEFRIAEVLNVAPARRLENDTAFPMSVKVGDKVLVGRYNGSDVYDDCMIVHEEEIIAIIKET